MSQRPNVKLGDRGCQCPADEIIAVGLYNYVSRKYNEAELKLMLKENHG